MTDESISSPIRSPQSAKLFNKLGQIRSNGKRQIARLKLENGNRTDPSTQEEYSDVMTGGHGQYG
jgi:hypothetical protein